MRELTRVDWFNLGERLYGPDRRKWKFQCVACGHVQSHESVKANKPDVGDTSNWIYFSCEGRVNPGTGCDWTLGGLFRIHRCEVRSEDGKTVPVFEFADDPDQTTAKALAEQKDDKRSKRR